MMLQLESPIEKSMIASWTPELAYKIRTQSLIGDTLRNVMYHTRNNDTDDYPTASYPNSLMLNHALWLQMDSGHWCSFFQGIEFAQNGIDFTFDPHMTSENTIDDAQFHEVTHHWVWSAFVGQRIIDIRYQWQVIDDSFIAPLYPHALQLIFANQKSLQIHPLPNSNLNYDDDLSEAIMILFDD